MTLALVLSSKPWDPACGSLAGETAIANCDIIQMFCYALFTIITPVSLITFMTKLINGLMNYYSLQGLPFWAVPTIWRC